MEMSDGISSFTDDAPKKQARVGGGGSVKVSSMSIIDWSCRKEAEPAAAMSPNPKGGDSNDTVHPSLVCGVSVREPSVEENASNSEDRNGGSEKCSSSPTVPALLVVTFDGFAAPVRADKNADKASGGGGASAGSGTSKAKLVSVGGAGGSGGGSGKVAVAQQVVNNNKTVWSILLEDDPWPSPAQLSSLKDGPTTVSSALPILQNGPSELSHYTFGSEGSSPLSPHMHMGEKLAELKKAAESLESNQDDEEGGGGREVKGVGRAGQVLQHIPLPPEFSHPHLQVLSIQPTVDRRYCIVVIAPPPQPVLGHAFARTARSKEQTVNSNYKRTGAGSQSEPMEVDVEPSPPPPLPPLPSYSSALTPQGGILVYKVKCCNGRSVLDETPSMMFKLIPGMQPIHQLYVLPPEVAEQLEEEESGGHLAPPPAPSGTNGLGVVGQVALIVRDGSLRILNLADAKLISSLYPRDGDFFVAATYCTGWLI